MLRPDLFIGAQAAMGPLARHELRQRVKRTHWIWFVFPQHRALGRSYKSKLFGLDLASAREYLRHPVLAAELVVCCRIVADGRYRRPVDLGPDDDMKLASSMTLFATAAALNGQRAMADLFDRARERQGLPLCARTVALADAELLLDGARPA